MILFNQRTLLDRPSIVQPRVKTTRGFPERSNCSLLPRAGPFCCDLQVCRSNRVEGALYGMQQSREPDTLVSAAHQHNGGRTQTGTREIDLSSPLAPPTCTKRTGVASSTPLAMAAMMLLALSPHR